MSFLKTIENSQGLSVTYWKVGLIVSNITNEETRVELIGYKNEIKKNDKIGADIKSYVFVDTPYQPAVDIDENSIISKPEVQAITEHTQILISTNPRKTIYKLIVARGEFKASDEI